MALRPWKTGWPILSSIATGSVRLGDHVFYCDAWKSVVMATAVCSAASRYPATSISMKWRSGWASTRCLMRPGLLGLGSPTGIELPGEVGGLIPTRAWKMERFHVPWQQGETLINGIGPGLCARHADSALHAGRADCIRQGGLTALDLSGPARRSPVCARPRRCCSRTRHSPWCARAWAWPSTRRAAQPMAPRILQAALRWRARPARPKCGVSPMKNAIAVLPR